MKQWMNYLPNLTLKFNYPLREVSDENIKASYIIINPSDDNYLIIKKLSIFQLFSFNGLKDIPKPV